VPWSIQRVRHLAIGLGILAKTDPIDAAVLMRFARMAEPRLAQKRSAHQTELDALITCRRQLAATRTGQGNCRQSTRSKAALKSIDAVLASLDKQIQRLDQEIRKLIDSDDDFTHLDGLLRSVPGVGPVLSATLLAELASWGIRIVARSARWLASLRSIVTLAPSEANAPFAAAARRCGASCTWRPSPPSAAIPFSARSLSDCVRPEGGQGGHRGLHEKTALVAQRHGARRSPLVRTQRCQKRLTLNTAAPWLSAFWLRRSSAASLRVFAFNPPAARWTADRAMMRICRRCPARSLWIASSRPRGEVPAGQGRARG